MRNGLIVALAIAVLAGAGFFVWKTYNLAASENVAAVAAVVSRLNYIFSVDGTLNEAGSMDESSSPYFWLNSGGQMLLKDGIGMTMQGDALLNNKWLAAYNRVNPVDTDLGLHPQNLFRLVTRSQWDNATQIAQFAILKDNFSLSPNHNASNGLLLMSRYAMDGQTLYYTGIRVDGTAVIKKKYHGTYYTMAQQKVFPGTYKDYQTDANLLPHQEWIALRSDTKTNADGSVTVTLFMKRANETTWTPLLNSTDSGQYGNTPPIAGPGYDGIRTDFMDVQFDNYSISPIVQ